MKRIILFISLFFVLVYIPLSISIYSQNFHQFNFKKQEITNQISFEKVRDAEKNLVAYFFHMEKLNENWTENEKKHMSEVR
ncbi:MAG: hypothetical protein KC550_03285, partial [Nanoarchaeota archaeon]|nr:hypothetical protein [Nanoarchaeota archaeon]